MRWLAMIFTFLAVVTPVKSTPTSASPCEMSARDSLWLEEAFRAWELVRREKLGLRDTYRPTIIVFDAHCRYEAKPDAPLRWLGSRHDGNVRLPDGEIIPVAVTSFAAPGDKEEEALFVMALPSVWEAAGVKSNLGLEGLLTAVFLHEYMHTFQARLMPSGIDEILEKAGMAEGASDDALQALYQSDPAYVAAYERERDLLYAAAWEPDLAKARRFAGEALQSMRERQARWFEGEKQDLKIIDDVFLTMEGIGQWGPYAWLIDPQGRGLDSATAEREMRRNKKWWTQDQGLALFLVIDRLLPGWQAMAFAPEPVLGIDLLAAAIDASETASAP